MLKEIINPLAVKYWLIRIKAKEAKFSFCYTDTCAAVKQTLLQITFFHYSLVYHNNSRVLDSWTVNNFAIVRMADAWGERRLTFQAT